MLIRSAAIGIVLIMGLTYANGDGLGTGSRLLMKIYEDCQRRGFSTCLKMKAITFFDRASRSQEINLGDIVTIVRDENVPISSVMLTEREVEESLPRGEEAKDARLNTILVSRIADFFNSHRVVFNLPKINPNELLEDNAVEGRGKMKKMMGSMMMGLAMKVGALIMAKLFLIAGKAFVMAKVALVLTLIMVFKKLMAQKSHHETWHSGGGGGGWDRRSYLQQQNSGQDLAYRGYAPSGFSSGAKA